MKKILNVFLAVMTTFLFMAKTTSADSIEPKGGVYELELSGTCFIQQME